MLALQIFKLTVITGLFVLFFCFFGFTTIDKYLRQDIMAVTTPVISEEGFTYPAITVCGTGEIGGWKSKQINPNNLTSICSNELVRTNFSECVNKGTFSLKETIKDVRVFNIRNLSNHSNRVTISNWTSSMPLTSIGMCHHLIVTEPLNRHDLLVIILNDGMKKFKVYLYDKNFFMLKSDNTFIPHIALESPTTQQLKFVTSRNKRMDRNSKFECNNEITYNYNQCVRQSLIDKIGCRYPWDNIKDNTQECKTTEEIEKYENAFYDRYYDVQGELNERTGCKVPCQYQHYDLVGTPLTFDWNKTYFTLQLASTEITTKEEILIFPFVSLVCEFGGSLGLFLGFSFFGTFDMIVCLVVSFRARCRHDKDTDIQAAENDIENQVAEHTD